MSILSTKENAASTEALAAQFTQALPTRYLASPAVLEKVAQHWGERQRCWHGPAHALAMLDEAVKVAAAGEERDALLLATVYHDANRQQLAPPFAQQRFDLGSRPVRAGTGHLHSIPSVIIRTALPHQAQRRLPCARSSRTCCAGAMSTRRGWRGRSSARFGR